MRLLALDIGTRRTGAATYDSATQIVLPLDTIQHSTFDELLDAVLEVVRVRGIERVIVGLPLLLSGKEGSQAVIIRQFLAQLQGAGISASTIDERYSTPKFGVGDGDAAAACSLLQLALENGS